jgi:urease
LSIHDWNPQRKDGRVFLVTVHDPICTEFGNIEAALYGSFLPIPRDNPFPAIDVSEYATEKMPGAIIAKKERIILNKGRERIKLRVTNDGDRPVQVSNLNSRKK